MKNITLSVPDEVYRRARVRAAERGSSVSALVRDYLTTLGDVEAEFVRLVALQQQVQTEIGAFSASDRLDRETLHDRAVR